MPKDQVEIRMESFNEDQDQPDDGYLVSIRALNTRPTFWVAQDLADANRTVTELTEIAHQSDKTVTLTKIN